jgi:hypothetical protein
MNDKTKIAKSIILLESSGQDSILFEEVLHARERNDLPASEFGLPELRKFPLNDKEHVLMAVRFFNKVEKKYERELAKNIMKKLIVMKLKVTVGENNRFKRYYDKGVTLIED